MKVFLFSCMFFIVACISPEKEASEAYLRYQDSRTQSAALLIDLNLLDRFKFQKEIDQIDGDAEKGQRQSQPDLVYAAHKRLVEINRVLRKKQNRRITFGKDD